jgi:hypothetical protein
VDAGPPETRFRGATNAIDDLFDAVVATYSGAMDDQQRVDESREHMDSTLREAFPSRSHKPIIAR